MQQHGFLLRIFGDIHSFKHVFNLLIYFSNRVGAVSLGCNPNSGKFGRFTDVAIDKL
jgi:hypothetical protein